jgi:hypothetical protein
MAENNPSSNQLNLDTVKKHLKLLGFTSEINENVAKEGNEILLQEISRSDMGAGLKKIGSFLTEETTSMETASPELSSLLKEAKFCYSDNGRWCCLIIGGDDLVRVTYE